MRDWRQRRRLSQLDLSNRTGVSTRHLSFIETGRATPSREMLGRLGDALEMPLREQRVLFTAAGFAPDTSENPLDAPELAHVTAAIDAILRGHEPYPVLVIDGGWNLVSANDAAYRLLGDLPPELLEPPVNVVRVSHDVPRTPDIVLTLRLRHGDQVLSFITTTTVFGTPRDVTVADLAIKALYPADEPTRQFLTGAAPERTLP